MKLFTLFFTFLFMTNHLNSQELPYRELEDVTVNYTAGSVASRMIDGLGFRYYWATEGLTDKDLSYKPNKGARSISETVDHILGLSQVVLNAVLKKPNGYNGYDLPEMSFKEKRELTLKNLKQASDLLKNETDLSEFVIIFGENKFPFWNAINGPIADAIWHSGQIASFRRSAGNPFPKGVSVFTGKVK